MRQANMHEGHVSSCWENRGRTGDGVKAIRSYYSYSNASTLTHSSFTQSCEMSAWIEHADTQIVQTCWAAMGLMYAKYPNPEPVTKAVKLVMSRQQPVRRLHLLTQQTDLTDFRNDRMDHGLKRRSRACSTKTVPFLIRISNFHFRFGCLGRPKSIWRSSKEERVPVVLIE